MSAGENVRFNGQRAKGQSGIFPKVPRVDLNNLMKKVKEEEKKTKRNNLAISLAALSVVAICGLVITL